MNPKKTIALVKYWNMFPLKHEFEKITKSTINIVEDHPKKINELVRQNQVLSGPCSSICLNHYPEMKKVSPHGVCAANHVYSVVAVIKGLEDGVSQYIKKRNQQIKRILEPYDLQRPLERKLAWNELYQFANANPYKNPPKLILSQDSETSVQLLKILSFLWFGSVHAGEHGQETWGLKLLIGDKALNYYFDKKRNVNHKVLDLGHQWHEMTSMPFVYAIWQSTKNKDPKISDALNVASIKAEQYMREDPYQYLKHLKVTERQESQLVKYWKKIYYRISAREETSLSLFLDFSKFLEQFMSKEHDKSLILTKNNLLTLRR